MPRHSVEDVIEGAEAQRAFMARGQLGCNGADDGLRAPFMICTMQMGGEFFSVATDEDGTMNWICF